MSQQNSQEPVRSLIILGSTGSIGTQTLEVIDQHPHRFQVVGLAAGGSSDSSIDELCRQIRTYGVTDVAVANSDAAQKITRETGVIPRTGPDAATELVHDHPEVHTVVNGLVGSLGLGPTLAALDAHQYLALANKESLVAGGELVINSYGRDRIIPVDSEHSAIAQCLRSGQHDEIATLVLTASGGPFRGWSAEDIEAVTPEQAAAHPTWSMGQMNTLNSATLVNKGLELIEAHLLFDVSYDDIDVVVHPQSIIHSMVTFRDGSTIAQASPPSMKIPLALGLSWPERLPDIAPACSFRGTYCYEWTFEPVDNTVFPAIDLARSAGRAGGTMTAVYNAANEEAAAAFLAGNLSFPSIVTTVERVLNDADRWTAQPRDCEDVKETERWARKRAHHYLKEMQ